MKLLIIICLISLSSAKYDYKNLINILVMFVKMEKMPIKINSNICWPKDTQIDLLKALNTAQIFTSDKFLNLQQGACPQCEYYLLDLECKNSLEILHKAYTNKLLNFPNRWLILQNTSIQFPEDMYVHLNSRIYLLNVNTFEINSIYKINEKNKFNSNQIAKWKDGKFIYYNQISDCRNRSNLMGIDMNISVVHMYEDTLNHLHDMKDRNIDAITKFNFLLTMHIVDVLNITKHLRFQNTWGIPDPNTSIYNGEIGDLQQGISEIGATACFYTNDRIGYIDYVAIATPTNCKFIFKAPALSVVSNVFTLPFHTSVWLTCFLILIIIFFVIYPIVKWEWSNKNFQEDIKIKYGILQPTIMDVIQMEIGAICQQGSESEPKSLAGRIGTFFIFLTLMFLYNSYSANIVALLQSTSDSVNTLEDLLNSNIKLGVEETPYSRYYSQIQTSDVQKAILQQKIAPPNKPDNFMPVLRGVAKMREEFFAFHAECDTIYKVISNTFLENEKCGLKEVQYWSITYPSIPIKKHSPYKELIKIGYLKMLERGLHNRNFKRIYTTKPICHNQRSNFISVSINDCYFPFISFAIGIFMSIFIFAMEKFTKKMIRKKKLKDIKNFKIKLVTH